MLIDEAAVTKVLLAILLAKNPADWHPDAAAELVAGLLPAVPAMLAAADGTTRLTVVAPDGTIFTGEIPATALTAAVPGGTPGVSVQLGSPSGSAMLCRLYPRRPVTPEAGGMGLCLSDDGRRLAVRLEAGSPRNGAK